jgi:choline dehydrogenase
VEQFDFILVGGGSAGCLLANRLVAKGHRVCLIESGPQDKKFFIRMPVGFVKTLYDPEITWQYRLDFGGKYGRHMNAAQGRTLGGSSSINGMVYVRGQADDYDHWWQLGNPGWSYEDLLPYFKRFERRISSAPVSDTFRGRSGALPVTDPDWRSELSEAFIAACHATGFEENPDYNGASQAGAGYYQRSIYRGRRVSAAEAFLKPVLNSANLKVMTETEVCAIRLDGKRAVGVVVLQGGRSFSIGARCEVIVCAGAINSPRLLQLSGIGDPDILKAAGVEIRGALRGVGKNLLDHYTVRMVARVKNTPTINELTRGFPLASQLLRWARRKPSILGLSGALCYAFGSSLERDSNPDYAISFTPASYQEGKFGVLDNFSGMTAGAWQLRPESTGHVVITSADRTVKPEIYTNYLKVPSDQKVVVSALRKVREIFNSKTLAPFFDGESFPGVDVQSDDEYLDFANRYGSTAYHFGGTCRMGPTDRFDSVVDSELNVIGFSRLRVVDASIFPSMVSGNTYVATLTIAEKAADIVLKQYSASSSGVDSNGR